MEETQEAGLEPVQEAETGDNIGVQYDKEVEPAPSHRTDFIENAKVKNVEEVQHPTHEEEKEGRIRHRQQTDHLVSRQR